MKIRSQDKYMLSTFEMQSSLGCSAAAITVHSSSFSWGRNWSTVFMQIQGGTYSGRKQHPKWEFAQDLDANVPVLVKSAVGSLTTSLSYRTERLLVPC